MSYVTTRPARFRFESVTEAIAVAMQKSEVRFWMLWWFIALVSTIDLWLVVAYQDVILDIEESAVCHFLISLDPQRLSYFLPAKVMGTTLVLGILYGIWLRLRQHGLAIAGGVATFQAWLLFYLTIT
ncbi:hypothetical protein Mal4_02250 [Maioricimonas rarisocia]|uniref:DUF5658 domain-containing protein n=1 Tax=Maioricimonas rarisocia TaxID=2528026 RepID=A0A517Z0F9_9PLAN|nr:hypothetical protein [Maioricimonas rarisocia]QDU35943.1 hypothetical protein Mal4_02250 [Maioricimonas rarisocia]